MMYFEYYPMQYMEHAPYIARIQSTTILWTDIIMDIIIILLKNNISKNEYDTGEY